MAGVFPESGVPASGAQNSLPNPDVVTGCAELWHSTNRCQPRFDPAAANAVMAEIINAVNCGGVDYDCNKLDNLCTALIELIHNVIHDCQRPFPAAEGCILRQVVLSTDEEGCTKIAYFDAAAARLATSTSCSVWPVGSRQLPADPLNPATFYTLGDLSADVIAGTVNQGLLNTNRLATITFDVPCDNTTVEIELSGSIVFSPSQNAGNGASSNIVYRVDGTIPVSGGTVAFISSVTNFERRYETTLRRVYDQGSHTVEFFVVAESSVRPPAQLGATCNANGTSSIAVEARIATS